MTTNEPGSVTRHEQIVRIVEVRGGGVCRSCNHQITWARTLKGEMMPLENELRVRALLSPGLRQQVSVRSASRPGMTGAEVVKSKKHEEKLAADGCRFRDELFLVWEIPASLTHWPNCKGADRHRKPKH